MPDAIPDLVIVVEASPDMEDFLKVFNLGRLRVLLDELGGGGRVEAVEDVNEEVIFVIARTRDQEPLQVLQFKILLETLPKCKCLPSAYLQFLIPLQWRVAWILPNFSNHSGYSRVSYFQNFQAALERSGCV